MQNSTSTLKNYLGGSYKTKYNLNIWSSKFLGVYPNELKTYVYTKLHTDVYSSFIPNMQNLEATKMSFSRSKDKFTVEIQMPEYTNILKRNELSESRKDIDLSKCIDLSKRSQFEKATDYMIPNAWHPGKSKTKANSERIRG